MAVLKCKMCGAPLEVTEGQQTVKCQYCDSVQTVPRVDDELKIKMFERATELRMNCEFDQAAVVFQNITTQYPDEAEAYWGLCLCEYGIEYVDDPKTGRKVPTCHRTNPTSILGELNFTKACQFASPVAKLQYEEEANVIEGLQKSILQISRAEQPYDVFVCYKETDDETGLRTEDSIAAQDIYTGLTDEGYKVFFARHTLRSKAGSEYEPYIYAALSSAKVMLVIGSKPQYFNAVWVKNEWARYLGMMQQGVKTIIPCFKQIDVGDLPVQLRHFQALDMEGVLFYGNLLNSIERVIGKPSRAVQPPVTAAAPKPANVSDVAASRKEFNYDDGVFVGEAVGNRPHGFGTRFYTDGRKYEGNWNLGNMHGTGTFTYKNGDSWTGEWAEDKPLNGNGRYHLIDGKYSEWLEGTLKNGKLSGEGKRYVSEKLVEEGTFSNGKLHGRGVAYNSDGTACRGEFSNGQPYTATGSFPIGRGDFIYTGEWINGGAEGHGLLKSADGKEKVEGYFKGGLNGNVIWFFKNGKRYEGAIQNGQRHGRGRLISENNVLIYDGEYKDGKQHGRGVLYSPSGWKYEGEFKNGLKHGQGTMYYNQGSWTGEWKDGERFKGNGLIIFYDDKGNATGKFYNGYIVNGKAAGRGMLRFPDGSRFDGEFYNDEYYNGVIYNQYNQQTDTYINGRSQAANRASTLNTISSITDTALDFLKGLGGF